MTEAHQEIQDADVPHEPEQRTDLVEPPINARREHDGRRQRERARNRALLRGAGVAASLPHETAHF